MILTTKVGFGVIKEANFLDGMTLLTMRGKAIETVKK